MPFKKYLIVFFFLTGLYEVAWGQIPGQFPNNNNSMQGGGFPGQMGPDQNMNNYREDGDEDGDQQAPKGDPRKILDDSTKSIYGPKTTQYLLEKDIRYNREEHLREIDTLLNNFHNYHYNDRLGRTYQDLGNVGTAMRPLYYKDPENIGLTSGFNVYDLYFIKPEDIRYFDTKSPYTELKYVIGGGERSFTDLTFSRNINHRWNVGLDFKRLSADKQIGSVRRGDKQVESTAYTFFTRYKSENEKYQALANFSRLNHKVFEIGGVNPVIFDEEEEIDYFDPINGMLLGSSRGQDFRYNIHTYQQYRLNEQIEAYHVFDFYRQANRFISALGGESGDRMHFPEILFNNDSTKDETIFRSFNNELGLKGNLKSLYYNLYLKRRDITYANNVRDTSQADNYLSRKRTFAENYIGFNMRYELPDDKYIEGYAEYLIGGNYKIGFNLFSKFANLKVSSMRYKAPLMAQHYIGNHLFWNNNFESVQSENLYADLPIKLGFLEFTPRLSASRVANYIYFDENLMPVQVRPDVGPDDGNQASNGFRGSNTFLLNPGADLNLTFLRNFHWDNSLTFNFKSGAGSDAFRIPDYFAFTRFYYTNILFNSNLQLQVGFEGFYSAPVEGLAYSPVLQNFHLQGSTAPFTMYGYPVADVFVNLKISRVRVFAKLVHVNQELMRDGGYFSTPLYPGQKFIFDAGLSWLFFD